MYSTASSMLSLRTSLGADVQPENKDSWLELRRSNKAKIRLTKLVQKLNAQYAVVSEEGEEENSVDTMNDSKVPISEEVAHWLIRLCHGDIKFDEWI